MPYLIKRKFDQWKDQGFPLVEVGNYKSALPKPFPVHFFDFIECPSIELFMFKNQGGGVQF